MTTLAVGNRRLLKLAAILEKVPNRKEKDGKRKFYMGRWRHACGTPSCAGGWWAFANPRRWDASVYLREDSNGTGQDLIEEFSLRGNDLEVLFSAYGMGGAKTGKQAAKFIRKFVQQRTEQAHG